MNLVPHRQYQKKMSGFSFSFSGDDIEDMSVSDQDVDLSQQAKHAAETGTLRRALSSAFPIDGQAQLPSQIHDLKSMLNSLPSKIVYNTLIVKLDDGEHLSIPRRELWDVRVQLMAEEDDEGLSNLGKDDVRTGVYEGGFKSWESSVDVVKVLHGRRGEVLGYPGRLLEVNPCFVAIIPCRRVLTNLSLDAELPYHLSPSFSGFWNHHLRSVRLENWQFALPTTTRRSSSW